MQRVLLYRTVTLLSMLFCAISNSSVTGSLTLSDNFNDNATDASFWSVFQAGTGPTVAERNSRVEISIPGNSHGSDSGPTWGVSDFGAGYLSKMTINGDFDMRVDYALPVWPDNSGVRAGIGLAIYFTAVARTSFAAVELGSAESDGDYYLTHFLDGVQGLIPTADESGKLRVTRVGETMSGYYWDGAGWSLINTGNGPTAPGQLSLVAWSHDQYFIDQDVLVAFDNFEVIIPDGTEINPVPEPSTYLAAALLLLPFALQALRWLRSPQPSTPKLRPAKMAG